MLVSNIQFTKYSSGLIHLENELGRSKTSYDVWGRDRGEGLSIVKTGMCREEYWLWMVHTHTRTHRRTKYVLYKNLSLTVPFHLFPLFTPHLCKQRFSKLLPVCINSLFVLYIFYTKIVHFYCGSVFCFCFFFPCEIFEKKKIKCI